MGERRIDLSVVIVTYNSRSFIERCLESVETTVVDHRVEIVVVDNASIDGTADFVRRRHPEVLVHDTGWNSGFSRACNAGVALTSGRFVVFLNGDAWVSQGALDHLCATLDARPDAGVVAPRLLNPDGTEQSTARAFPTAAALVWGRRSPLTRWFPNNRFSRAYLVGRDHEGFEPFAVDWVSGGCLMTRRHLLAELGGLDERFFMYWEDADYCRSVAAGGHDVLCDPGALVHHAEGSSASVTTPRQNRRFHLAAYQYIAKHHLTGPSAVLRPVAAGVLAARAGAVRIGAVLAERRSPTAADDDVVIDLRTSPQISLHDPGQDPADLVTPVSRSGGAP